MYPGVWRTREAAEQQEIALLSFLDGTTDWMDPSGWRDLTELSSGGLANHLSGQLGHGEFPNGGTPQAKIIFKVTF